MNAAGAQAEAHGGAPFPWGEAMRFGLARLRLPPEQFWRMTPRELAVMAGAGRTSDAPARHRLAELMTLHPDKDDENDEFR